MNIHRILLCSLFVLAGCSGSKFGDMPIDEPVAPGSTAHDAPALDQVVTGTRNATADSTSSAVNGTHRPLPRGLRLTRDSVIRLFQRPDHNYQFSRDTNSGDGERFNGKSQDWSQPSGSIILEGPADDLTHMVYADFGHVSSWSSDSASINRMVLIATLADASAGEWVAAQIRHVAASPTAAYKKDLLLDGHQYQFYYTGKGRGIGLTIEPTEIPKP